MDLFDPLPMECGKRLVARDELRLSRLDEETGKPAFRPQGFLETALELQGYSKPENSEE